MTPLRVQKSYQYIPELQHFVCSRSCDIALIRSFVIRFLPYIFNQF